MLLLSRGYTALGLFVGLLLLLLLFLALDFNMAVEICHHDLFLLNNISVFD